MRTPGSTRSWAPVRPATRRRKGRAEIRNDMRRLLAASARTPPGPRDLAEIGRSAAAARTCGREPAARAPEEQAPFRSAPGATAVLPAGLGGGGKRLPPVARLDWRVTRRLAPLHVGWS